MIVPTNTVEALTQFIMSIEGKIEYAQKVVRECDPKNIFDYYAKDQYLLYVIPALEVGHDLAKEIINKKEYEVLRQNHPFFVLMTVAKTLNDKVEGLKVFRTLATTDVEVQANVLATGVYQDMVDEALEIAKRVPPPVDVKINI